MEFLREWLLSVAAASVIGTLLLLISPEGTMKTPIKVIVSLFVTLTFVSPLVKSKDVILNNSGKKLDEFFEKIELENEIENEIKAELENEISVTLSSVLEDAGISVLSVVAEVEISKSYDIFIKDIRIIVSDNELADADRIVDIVIKNYGVTPKIEVDSNERTDTNNQ